MLPWSTGASVVPSYIRTIDGRAGDKYNPWTLYKELHYTHALRVAVF